MLPPRRTDPMIACSKGKATDLLKVLFKPPPKSFSRTGTGYQPKAGRLFGVRNPSVSAVGNMLESCTHLPGKETKQNPQVTWGPYSEPFRKISPIFLLTPSLELAMLRAHIA